MLITVPTTSTNLSNILSSDQRIAVSSGSSSGSRECIVQNLGSTSIFVDFGIAAAVSSGIKVPANDSISFNITGIEKAYFISETSPNANVRVSITT